METESTASDLDISWLKREENIEKGQFIKESMDSITCYVVYIDVNNSIEKIDEFEEPLTLLGSVGGGSVGGRGIKRGRMLELIETLRKVGSANYVYKLMDLVGFHVDHAEIGQTDYSSCFGVMNTFGDLVIADSIFIFHDINTLYFLFQASPPKSILKVGRTRKNYDGSEVSSMQPVVQDVPTQPSSMQPVAKGTVDSVHNTTHKIHPSGGDAKTRKILVK
jgi:hypothetical protein